MNRSTLAAHIKPHTAAFDFSGPLIKVTVGAPSKRKTFLVQESLLISSSDYFKAALMDQWQEGQDRSVDLSEDDPDSFNVFVNWLYQRQVPIFLDESENIADDGNLWSKTIRAYALGDKLLAGDFKDVLTDAMVLALTATHRENNYLPNKYYRSQLYATSSEGSKLRQMLVHAMSLCDCSDALTVEDDPELLLQLAKSLMTGKTTEPLMKAARRCAFHEHGDQECYRKKYSFQIKFDTT